MLRICRVSKPATNALDPPDVALHGQVAGLVALLIDQVPPDPLRAQAPPQRLDDHLVIGAASDVRAAIGFGRFSSGGAIRCGTEAITSMPSAGPALPATGGRPPPASPARYHRRGRRSPRPRTPHRRPALNHGSVRSATLHSRSYTSAGWTAPKFHEVRDILRAAFRNARLACRGRARAGENYPAAVMTETFRVFPARQ